MILVISITEIPADAQLFLPYGADYWCQDKFPITILAAAIRCYNIDIHSSPQWSQLQAYAQLCTLFPKTQPSHTAFDPTTVLADYTPTPAERRLYDRIGSTSCPPDVHSKPDLESSRSRKHHKQAYHQLIAHCRNNQYVHALYLQSTDLDHAHLQHLADVLPTTHIYAINLGEAEFSATSLQFLHDFLPSTSITQIYLHHHTHTDILRNIQLRAEQNRQKVQVHYASRGIIPAEWKLISKRAEAPIQYTDDYVSSQSTTSTDHLEPHPPPSQEHDAAPTRSVAATTSPVLYDSTWNRYPRNRRHTTTAPTYSIGSLSAPPQSLLQFRRLHNDIFSTSPLWSKEGDARAEERSPCSNHKRKRSELLEDAPSLDAVPSRQEPDTHIDSIAIIPSVVSVLSQHPRSPHRSGLVPRPRIDSPVFTRSVRARLSPAIFDHDMFRTIFGPELSNLRDSSGHSTNFSFSFSIDTAAPINIATTLHYDKHIVDS